MGKVHGMVEAEDVACTHLTNSLKRPLGAWMLYQ
jgi:hypothetical protein